MELDAAVAVGDRAEDRRAARRAARRHAGAHRQAVRGDAHARGRLGHARRGRALRVHDHARLRGAAPARPAGRSSAVRAGARLAAGAAGRRVRDPDLGQVLAVDDRPLRVRGRQSDPARAVPAARLGAAASQQLLLPHAVHLSRHRLPVWAAFQMRIRANSRPAPSRAICPRICEHRFRRASPRYRAERSARAAQPAAARALRYAEPVREAAAAAAAPARAFATASGASSTSRRRAAGRGCRRSTGCSTASPCTPSAIRCSSRRCRRWSRGSGRTRRRASATAARTRPRGTRRSACAPCSRRRRAWSRGRRCRRRCARPTTGCATRRCRPSCPDTRPSGAPPSSAAGASPTACTAGRSATAPPRR